MTRAARGRTACGMASERPPAKASPAAAKLAEREAKLAKALRANLRRRKAEPKAKPAKPADGDSG